MNKALDEIIRVMGRTHGRDISMHDEAFLAKSLDKRLAATGIKSAAEYCDVLSSDSTEAEAFSSSLNITYSEFFRNPLTFAVIEQLVLPGLVEEKQKAGRGEIRVWSAGCAAGHEAYSIAMLLNELTDDKGNSVAFRIFATDRSDTELASARRGVYDSTAVRNVRLKHIQKYFSVKGESYSIVESLKDRLDFSFYDLLEEHSVCPPACIYGDFDLVLCGNLLFYYRPDIRRLILNKVYRALSPGGYLATGEAEREIVAKHEGFRAVVTPSSVFQKTGRGGENR
jgi:chemotaxis methyl-accepting protein methylase